MWGLGRSTWVDAGAGGVYLGRCEGWGVYLGRCDVCVRLSVSVCVCLCLLCLSVCVCPRLLLFVTCSLIPAVVTVTRTTAAFAAAIPQPLWHAFYSSVPNACRAGSLGAKSILDHRNLAAIRARAEG